MSGTAKAQKKPNPKKSTLLLMVGTVAVVLVVFFWLRITMPDPDLRIIRLGQIYSSLALVVLFGCMLAGSVAALLDKRSKQKSWYAGAAILITIAWSVACFAQFGGFNGFAYLPAPFFWTLAGQLVVFVSTLCLLLVPVWLQGAWGRWLGAFAWILYGVCMLVLGTYFAPILLKGVLLAGLATWASIEAVQLQRYWQPRLKAWQGYVCALAVWLIVLGGFYIALSQMKFLGADYETYLTSGVIIHGH